MTELNESELNQARKIAQMSKISRILENIRNVIAKDKMQKQPLMEK